MKFISSLPPAGAIVIVVILALFLLAVLLLVWVYGRYRRIASELHGLDDIEGDFLSYLADSYTDAYRVYGENVNTPALIENAMSQRLNGLLLSERFMNSAVSLFVTLGLFGTFLGLSLSVSSLTELINLSNPEEWLSVLDSVGGGLVSALSGMGVAFYTSLTGVACSIVFTVLRTILNPQAQREKLQNAAELWLDHSLAPTLETEAGQQDATGLGSLRDDLKKHAMIIQRSLTDCTRELDRVLTGTTNALGDMIAYSKEPIQAFYETVNTFNSNVRDFSEFNYDLRGNIERMDLCFRDLSTAVRGASRDITARDGREARESREVRDARDGVGGRRT